MSDFDKAGLIGFAVVILIGLLIVVLMQPGWLGL